MSEVVKEHAHRYFICDTFLMKWYHPSSRQLTCIQPRVCAVLKLRNKIVHSNLLLWVCWLVLYCNRGMCLSHLWSIVVSVCYWKCLSSRLC